MLGLATGAAAQTTCAATDAAITGVSPAPSNPAALAGDCSTLLGLMDTLRGTASLNWANTLSMASWDGVTLASNKNRVAQLELVSKSLTGSLPDLSALAGLDVLRLNTNKLTGSIPDLSALTSLDRVWLDNNKLTGSLVAAHFPASLRELTVGGNGLTESIPDLSAFTSLEYLWLHRNKLTGSIPTTLGDLTSLQSLHLAWNSLTGGIPSELDNLTSLATFSLCRNDLDDSANLPSALEARRAANSLAVRQCLGIEDAEGLEGTVLSFDLTQSTWPVRGGGSLTVDYETEAGTATSADYTSMMGSVTFPVISATETEATTEIQVPTTGDSLVEGDETFTVVLSVPSQALPLRRFAVGTIRDNTPPNQPPRVSVSCHPCAVTPGGEAILTATASDPDDDPLIYAWSASGGTFDGAADTPTVRWTAPATVGSVTIRVTVSDGEGGTDSARVTMDVYPTLPEKLSFDIPDRGSMSFSTTGGAAPPRVGYGQIRPDGGRPTPSGMALYELRGRDGVLITEEAVPASAPVHQGRIFAEVGGPVRTAVAFANPNGRPADIDYYLTDSGGNRIGEGSFTLEAYGHMAGFLGAEPFNVENVVGTFTFSASPKVVAMAFWELINAPGECLVAALPVLPLGVPPSPFSGTSTAPVVIPHFANGDGWSTDVILVNPTWEPIAGTLELVGPDGRVGTSFEYAIAPHSAQRSKGSNSDGRVASGWVRVTSERGVTPQAVQLLTFASDGKTVAAAGVAATGVATGFRIPVEEAGMPGGPGSIRTGLAIANTTDEEISVSLEITLPEGSLVAPLGSLTLPPYGQTSQMLDAIMDLLEEFSSGMLRVSATGLVAVTGLRIRINERGELKATSLWPSNELALGTTRDRYFAHLADTDGWATELVLFSGRLGETSSGNLCLFWFPVE